MIQLARRSITFLDSRIQFKIILPFALLTVMVSVIGTYLSTRLVSGSLEERFTAQLLDTASGVADGLVQREQFHLAELRAIAFTEGVAEAIIADDRDRLQTILFPIMVNNNLARVDVVGHDGRQIITIRRPPGTTTKGDYTITSGQDMSNWPTVDKVLNGVIDNEGDKQVALTTVADGDQLFITAGPVKLGEEIVGVILINSHLQNMLRSLQQATFADITFYTLDGQVLDTTLPDNNITRHALTIDPLKARRLLDRQSPTTMIEDIIIQDREYRLLHDLFWARGMPQGFFSVALQTQYIAESGATARNQMAIIFIAALILVFGVGFLMSNMITGQVQYLMENARAVAGGDLTRRTQITSHDEIGMLAQSLDNMTTSLAQYTNDLQRKIDEITALYESSTAFTGISANLDHVLRAVTKNLKEVMRQADQVVIHLFDEESQTLTPIISTPNDAGDSPPLLINSQGKIQEILAAAKPQIIALADMNSHSPQGSFEVNGHAEVLIAPLIAGQEIIGMLSLTLKPDETGGETKLNDDSMHLLGIFANQAAIAIQNAQFYQEEQRLNTLKMEFINMAAHELRTPLGVIMGHASFVEKRAPEKLRKYMNFIVISGLRMRAMVDAMLTIQRLDARTTFLKVRQVDIRNTINKLVTDYRPMAELEGHTLEVDLPTEPLLIEADPEKIDMVFSNLLANAIKFTPENGRVDITARDSGDSVLVSISDTGVGIPARSQQHIFERFYQVPIEYNQERGTMGMGAGRGGLGIGLTIVKELLDLHNGDVWVESEINKGSTFFVILPKVQPAKKKLDPTATSQIQPA